MNISEKRLAPEDLGYNDKFERYRIENHLIDLDVGRVIAEHKERYIVKTHDREIESEIIGKLRFTAKNREDFPAVGDWVALSVYDQDLAVIHHIFPRFSVIKRRAAGQSGEVQIIAANVDYAFIIMSVNRDFSLNRLERYLSICNVSGISPIVILNKSDLLDQHQIAELTAETKARVQNFPVIALSNETRTGYESLQTFITKGKTYCLLGSSGVGKSTLLNNLQGRNLMKTDSISKSANRGKHITSHRELFLLENGGMIIDNPGMREVGIADSTSGLEVTFNKIADLAETCRFKNCTHSHETDCAVVEAVQKGIIDEAGYLNYLRLEKEKAHFETTVEERRKKEKVLSKIIKDYHKSGVKKNY